ncbi:short-chain dehydrogenase [Actinomadura sp. CNU-125]|uniref:SDR family NAD(P)-dependent oxidoreductase n=1 Tax=Actinomadura sp. CNU-125 TaxID=1904961 RepID=UPI0009594B8D|nr:SDR family NAD(P)-dependent oxidoreductase [Actinomadura sp. CNU-125]OLT11000.1 short-chain dehydrogenase [Actinomadura sp. CNU-125]
MELRDTPILLTGASGGIGRALAFALAGRGARLALAARGRDALESAAEEIAARGGTRPAVFGVDLSRPGAAAELGRDAVAALGSVRVLVNNAGAGLVGTQAELGDGAAVRALFETNFWSPVALARAVLPGMRGDGPHGSGLIVNVTSTLQSVPVPALGHYGAAKAALGHATRTLRGELRGTGVRVLEFVPGATDTAARDIDLLPWRDGPVRKPPPVSPESARDAIVRAIEGGARRRAHPATSLLPLELPAAGR